MTTNDEYGQRPLSGRRFQIAGWTVQPELNRISNGRETIQVEPRLILLLLVLAERPGQVISREDLYRQVWGEVVVSEESLTRAVSELRRILGDDSRRPRIIETIRKGGYRLVTSVEFDGGRESEAPTESGLPAFLSSNRRAMSVVAISIIVIGLAITVLLPIYDSDREERIPPAAMLDVKPFTTYAGHEERPAISPDGTRVAFCWPGKDENWDIYLKQRDTDVPLRLTRDPAYDYNPAWSPDGAMVAFVRALDVGAALYRVPAIGGDPELLYSAASWIPGLDWSPDGERIIFAQHGPGENRYQLTELDLTSGITRILINESQPGGSDMLPVYSPDGSWIAFVRSDPMGIQEIYLMPAAGGIPRQLTRNQINIRGLDWLPDSESLVFASIPAGAFALWTVSIESNAVSPLLTRGEWIANPSVATRTGTLVYEDLRFEKNIYQRSVVDTGLVGSTRPLIGSTQWDSEPCYSPDGERIVFTSSRTGDLEVWVCNRDGSRPLPLTSFRGAYLGWPKWSPDGRTIAFVAGPRGYADIYVIDAEGGSPRRLLSGDYHDIFSCWAPDSRALYFTSDRDGEWRIWKTDLAGESAEPLPVSNGMMARVTPDGKQLIYFAFEDRPGLYQTSLTGDAEGSTRLPVDVHDGVNLEVTSKGVYYISVVQGEQHLMLRHHDDGEIADLGAVNGICQPSLAIAPDESHILFSRFDRHSIDLMIVDRLYQR
jgi:Tol biopolymer transport system component/DNA-binding winged helix-turn-helix (wHTH) protein